ncbi:MAG: ComF family protein [Gammaproteobacteria bacterium]|nr:ComF family protein [Gammaproteobacteria bacterium]MBT8151504.1 ComF family protein [Gammaproteobacteria bacterium]NND39719.1 ComF family protein [Pseudomonadales bacterium]NNM12604.1 ComF family protein [Pseudomonadales bacterium]
MLAQQRIDCFLTCERCALPLTLPNASLCADCQQSTPVFSSCTAATVYNPLVGRLVNGLKHHRELFQAPILSDLLYTSLLRRSLASTRDAGIAAPIDLLLPVPLHPQRLRERGFNQALEIAKPLALRLRIPLERFACVRTQSTSSQQGLARAARTANMRGVFRCDQSVQQKCVAIIDDVMTTGSTVDAVAHAVLLAGASSCEVWCVARTAEPGAAPLRIKATRCEHKTAL